MDAFFNGSQQEYPEGAAVRGNGKCFLFSL